jgi:Asp-tRNA(Asn)/Glu-tRNA(Gln) amidotransferase A subunit family amidase
VAPLASAETRRRFIAHFSGLGLGSTLLPGALWGEMQQAEAEEITLEMLRHALAISGLEFSEEDEQAMLQGVNDAVARYVELREIKIPNDVSPPFHFSALVPGMRVNRTAEPFRTSPRDVRRPADLEAVAFWPVVDLAELVRTRQVRSIELTEMYLDRLRRYNPVLNCVVTLTDDLALRQAAQADAEIAAGRYRGPLHGIPWGAKDIIAVRGYPTTWGSGAYKDQVIDGNASVVDMLAEAGAVLVAKLTSGELAAGDRWFGGQTRNPWNPSEGSGGSSAGPGSATAAGLVGFSIGTETSGSILGPSSRCGVTGLRPTLGRISRHGVMALSWTQDRLGPMCRYAEDCALVMSVIARPDDRDMSVADLPFNWDAEKGLGGIRFGYVKEAFDEVTDAAVRRDNERTLEQIRSLGFELLEVQVPDFTTDVSAIGVESSAFFYDLVQSDRDKLLTNPSRGTGFRRSRLIPAVEYLQHQRIRMMMMMELAQATAHVDVYVAPRGGGGAAAATAAAPDTASAAAAGAPAAPGAPSAAAPAPQTPPSAAARHSSMANLATYPAVSMPNGFLPNGSPSAVTFFARPFGESELLRVAKAYQDATRHHLEHPRL